MAPKAKDYAPMLMGMVRNPPSSSETGEGQSAGDFQPFNYGPILVESLRRDNERGSGEEPSPSEPEPPRPHNYGPYLLNLGPSEQGAPWGSDSSESRSLTPTRRPRSASLQDSPGGKSDRFESLPGSASGEVDEPSPVRRRTQESV